MTETDEKKFSVAATRREEKGEGVAITTKFLMTEDERKGDCISYELLVTIVTRVGFCGYDFPVGGTHFRAYALTLKLHHSTKARRTSEFKELTTENMAGTRR
jgi:hypothetical protein